MKCKNVISDEKKEEHKSNNISELIEEEVVNDNLGTDNIKVTIEREDKPLYAAVSFDIYVDDEKVYTIENNSKKVFSIKPGTHSIYIRIDREKSEIIDFNNDVSLKLSVLGVGKIKLEKFG